MKVNFGRISWNEIGILQTNISKQQTSKGMKDVRDLHLVLLMAFAEAVQAEKDKARALGVEIDPRAFVTLSFEICIEPYAMQTYVSHDGLLGW
jgi:hypothetical protein